MGEVLQDCIFALALDAMLGTAYIGSINVHVHGATNRTYGTGVGRKLIEHQSGRGWSIYILVWRNGNV